MTLFLEWVALISSESFGIRYYVTARVSLWRLIQALWAFYYQSAIRKVSVNLGVALTSISCSELTLAFRRCQFKEADPRDISVPSAPMLRLLCRLSTLFLRSPAQPTSLPLYFSDPPYTACDHTRLNRTSRVVPHVNYYSFKYAIVLLPADKKNIPKIHHSRLCHTRFV